MDVFIWEQQAAIRVSCGATKSYNANIPATGTDPTLTSFFITTSEKYIAYRLNRPQQPEAVNKFDLTQEN